MRPVGDSKAQARPLRYRESLSALAAGAVFLLACACSPSSVNLATAPNPGAKSPDKPGEKPSQPDPANPNQPPVDPVQPPSGPGQPTRPQRFLVFCGLNSQSSHGIDLTVLSSTLGPLDHGQAVVFVDSRFPANKPITAFDRNLDTMMGFPGRFVAPFTIRTLFLGRPTMSETGFRLYVADVNVASRSGRARPIGPGLEPSAAAQSAAQDFGGQTRKFGASDRGTYLFIPSGSSGFTVLRANDMATVGHVEVGGDALMPQMDEENRVFWAWSYGGGGMSNRFFAVGPAGSGFSASSLGSFGGGSQTPAQAVGGGRFAWAEAPGARDGVARTLMGVLATPRARATSRFTIADERGTGFFRPMAAGLRLADGGVGLAVGEEDIDHAHFPWRARRLEMRVYRLGTSGGGAAGKGGESGRALLEAVAPYPQGALEALQEDNPLFLHEERFAMRGATALLDGSQALLTMQTWAGPMNFRLVPLGGNGALVDGVGDEVCRFPGIIQNQD